MFTVELRVKCGLFIILSSWVRLYASWSPWFLNWTWFVDRSTTDHALLHIIHHDERCSQFACAAAALVVGIIKSKPRAHHISCPTHLQAALGCRISGPLVSTSASMRVLLMNLSNMKLGVPSLQPQVLFCHVGCCLFAIDVTADQQGLTLLHLFGRPGYTVRVLHWHSGDDLSPLTWWTDAVVCRSSWRTGAQACRSKPLLPCQSTTKISTGVCYPI